MAETANMKTYSRGGVKKSPMSGYKFKNVGNSRGPVSGGKKRSKRYGQSTGKNSPSNSSVKS